MRRIRQQVGLGVLLMTMACHHGPAPQGVAPRPGPATLVVINHEWLDMRAYVVHGGTSTQVGFVPAMSSRTFVVSGRYLEQDSGQIRLLAEWIGAAAAVATEPLTVRPGQKVTWTLELGFRIGGIEVE